MLLHAIGWMHRDVEIQRLDTQWFENAAVS